LIVAPCLFGVFVTALNTFALAHFPNVSHETRYCRVVPNRESAAVFISHFRSVVASHCCTPPRRSCLSCYLGPIGRILRSLPFRCGGSCQYLFSFPWPFSLIALNSKTREAFFFPNPLSPFTPACVPVQCLLRVPSTTDPYRNPVSRGLVCTVKIRRLCTLSHFLTLVGAMAWTLRRDCQVVSRASSR